MGYNSPLSCTGLQSRDGSMVGCVCEEVLGGGAEIGVNSRGGQLSTTNVIIFVFMFLFKGSN